MFYIYGTSGILFSTVFAVFTINMFCCLYIYDTENGTVSAGMYLSWKEQMH